MITKLPQTIRILVLAVFLLVSAILAYGLTTRLIGQIHYQHARNDFRTGRLYPAIQKLMNARRYHPSDQAICKLLAQCYQKASDEANQTNIAWALAQQSMTHFRTAARLNPLDPESAYGMALTEMRLKQLFPHVFPRRKFNPFNPLPHFQAAIRLYPTSYPYHLALARYLHAHHQPEQLNAVIQSMTQIYPGASAGLIHETFWSASVQDAIKKGLRQAIDLEICPRIAHQRMAALLEKEKDYSGAIHHYRQSLSLPTSRNTVNEYFYLGRLYWKSSQYSEAEYCFFKGLDISPNRDEQIKNLFRDYQREGAPALLKFYDQVKSRYPVTIPLELALVRALVELKHFNQANDMLDSLNQRGPQAEIFYLQSRIAESQKDWDRMELAIQKATVLDPRNQQYRRTLIDLLKKREKWDLAEQELDRLMDSQKTPTHPLFDERAQMRFNRKNYTGAIDDWKESLHIKPGRANLMAQIAESYIRLGDLNESLFYYRQALSMYPGNAQYRQKIQALNAD